MLFLWLQGAHITRLQCSCGPDSLGCPWLVSTPQYCLLSHLHTLLFSKIYSLLVYQVGFCWSKNLLLLQYGENNERWDCILIVFFPSFSRSSPWTSDWHPLPSPAFTRRTNMSNLKRAAPPWLCLIIEKKTGNILYPPQLSPRLPCVLSPPLTAFISAPPPSLSLRPVRCSHNTGVHVSRSGGSAALFCAPVPLDVTEQRRSGSGFDSCRWWWRRSSRETGPGPGGEASWLPTARSPKPCPSFSYSPF